MKVKTKIDYYKITLPSDLIQSPDQWLEQMSAIAINEAKESARLYCVPCTWDCHLVSGGPSNESGSTGSTLLRCAHLKDQPQKND